jgi:hypothetical protein
MWISNGQIKKSPLKGFGKNFITKYPPTEIFSVLPINRPGKALHHASQVRFMEHSAASYILMLDEQNSQAQNLLHKFACSDESVSFHSAMKHLRCKCEVQASCIACIIKDR